MVSRSRLEKDIKELIGEVVPFPSRLPQEIVELVENGFAVHLLPPRSKAPDQPEWSTAPVATLEELEKNYRWGMNFGVRVGQYSKIRGGYLHAIDVDVRDASRAEEAREALQHALGEEIRVDQLWKVASGSGGASSHYYLLLDRPIRFRRLAQSDSFCIIGEEEKRAWQIELFGTGRQLVLPPSIHPDTGNEYRWERKPDFQNVRVYPSSTFAPVLQEQVQREGSAPLGLSVEQVRWILGQLPDWANERNLWRDAGMAVKYELGDEGWDVFDEWSQRGKNYKPRENRRQWKSFKNDHPNPITMRTLAFEVRRRGILFPDELRDLFDDLDYYSPDENGAITALADRYAGELVYDHTARSWYRFNGASWARENSNLALDYARSVCLELARHYPKNKSFTKVSTWENVERGARSDREFSITSDVWNRDKMVLGTPEGVVDLCTGDIRKAEPRDYINRSTAVAPIPLDRFKPERDCPRWLAFLEEALSGDEATIRFLQQWGGYCLTGDTREQVLTFVYGPGGSGKSTAVNTIADILGDYAINVGMETLTSSSYDRHTTELARMKGARMARASETEKGRTWAENRIKLLTGQDTITARFMHRDDFEFVPELKLTIVGNNRPTLKDVDKAIRRRFIVLPFTNPPKVKDPLLPEKLRAEWPGILSWLLLGCLDWQKHGLVRPQQVDEATTAYLDNQDVFGQWLADCCELGAHYVDTNKNLWNSWCSFAKEIGADPGSLTGSFPDMLEDRGFVRIKDTNGIRGRGYKGLRVRRSKRWPFDDDDLI